MSLNNTTFDEDPDYYLITFEHNNYKELIINYELVKFSDNVINEDEQECIEISSESGEYTNRGVSIRSKEREISKNNKQNSYLNSELLSLELPTFNPIQNYHPLYKGFVILPHKFQLGIISQLSHF
ncbi:24189_t:CDS:2 [Cetraspora pellucida]|uniref:24189_t:CDS:1 n=1 Tax=Cetraspora pellucida TaxID=1433469 RepID=A0A9N9DQV1_9GLOM|nr:24189_t:CDS:2 [Cetraspora pellucida]